MCDVGFSIVIEENIRIDTFEIQFDWVTPSFHRVFGFYHHISHSSRELGGNHIEGIIVRIVSYGRCIYAGTDTGIFHFEL